MKRLTLKTNIKLCFWFLKSFIDSIHKTVTHSRETWMKSHSPARTRRSPKNRVAILKLLLARFSPTSLDRSSRAATEQFSPLPTPHRVFTAAKEQKKTAQLSTTLAAPTIWHDESARQLFTSVSHENVQGEEGPRGGPRYPEPGDRPGREGHHQLRGTARIAWVPSSAQSGWGKTGIS